MKLSRSEKTISQEIISKQNKMANLRRELALLEKRCIFYLLFTAGTARLWTLTEN
jgi:hypothetical protein